MHYLERTSILYYQFMWEKKISFIPQINLAHKCGSKQEIYCYQKRACQEKNMDSLINIAQPH
jgi:hypothetical protein